MRIRSFIICCLLWTFSLTPDVTYAQDLKADIDAAVAAYEDDNPVETVQRLHAILTAAEVDRLPSDALARVYTYLAMSEWAVYRRPEAQAAMESAIRTDAKTFIKYAGTWAEENRTVTDSVVSVLTAGAIAFYEDAEYASSVNELVLLLPLEDIMRPYDTGEIHKYLAFCYVAMRKNSLAQQEFRTALQYNPQLELGDDAVVAPKLRRAFLAVRRDAIQKSQRSIRRNTILRSLVWPGWGQLYRGSRLRGYGFMATEFVSLTGMFLSIRSYGRARDTYVQFGVNNALAVYNQRNSVEDVRAELDARYNRFRSKSTQANTLIAVAVGIWACNVIDAFVLSIRREGMAVAGQTDHRNAGLAVDWNPAEQRWAVRYQVAW